MKHALYTSMLLCLLMVHCVLPAAEPGAASCALSSSSPAPAKVAALAQVERSPESAYHEGLSSDGKREAEFHGAGSAAAAAASSVTPYVFVPPVLKPMSVRQRKKLNTKLLKAVEKPIGGEAEVATLLVQGADPNARFNNNGGYALNFAAVHGNIANIKALLDARADVNAKGDNDQTPIFYAVEFDAAAAMKELIKYRADIACKNKYGETIHHFAHRSYTQLFLINLGLDENASEQVFAKACERDNVDVVRVLLDKGLGVNSRMRVRKYGEGCMPLHIAAVNNASRIVGLLLERKADLHAPIVTTREIIRGMTPCGCAYYTGKSKVLDALLQAGANKDLMTLFNEQEQTSFTKMRKPRRDKILAASFELKPKKFKVLQTHGVIDDGVLEAIDLYKMLGARSLISQLVIDADNDELGKMFTENRVSQHDLMRRDDAYMNAVLWAAVFGNVDAMKFFRERGNSLPLAFADAGPIGWKAKLKAKIGKRPIPEKPIPFNPFCKDEFGNSAVMLAKTRNDAAMVNCLYECNARARLGIASLIARNRITKRGRPVPGAVSNHIAEFVHGGRFVARPALVAGLLESPKSIGAAAAAAAGRFELPKAESKEAREFAKKD